MVRQRGFASFLVFPQISSNNNTSMVDTKIKKNHEHHLKEQGCQLYLTSQLPFKPPKDHPTEVLHLSNTAQ